MRSSSVLALLAVCMTCLTSAQAQPAQNYLANNTVLIVRHAEKPAEGTGLTPMGEARAQLYAKYFQPFQEEEISVSVDCLYAGADSKNSIRPRLTLEPLSKATGLPLHLNIGTKDPEALVHELKAWKLTASTRSSHGVMGRYPLFRPRSELHPKKLFRTANGLTMFSTG